MMNNNRPSKKKKKKKKRRKLLCQKIILVVVICCCILLQLNWLLNLHNNDNNNKNTNNGSISISIMSVNPEEQSSTTTNYFNNNNNSRRRNLLEWKDGCLSSSSSSSSLSSSSTLKQQQKHNYKPRGIIITMALAPKGNREFINIGRQQICNNLINQWELFALQQQNIDFLLVVQNENIRWNLRRFSKCLNLYGKHNQTETWTFLHNNSTLTTTSYQYSTSSSTSKVDNNDTTTTTTTSTTNTNNNNTSTNNNSITIYLASTIVDYPLHIQRNMSKLDERKLNYSPGCSARLRYLQGCRWYTYEMLHLSLLQKYDYFIKMDYDIVFVKPLEGFNLINDMYRKNAIFGHTAQYHPKGDGSCSYGILNAITDFLNYVNSSSSSVIMSQQQQQPPSDTSTSSSSSSSLWKKSICSNESIEMKRNADQYYCNFIIGSIEYFTNIYIRQFGQYLSEWPTNGYFKYKWGDQIFWHYALGLLLEKDYKKYVVDYTDLRCKPNPNCWYSVFDTKEYGINASDICSSKQNIFAHTKNLHLSKQIMLQYHQKQQQKQQEYYFSNWDQQQQQQQQELYPLFQSTYKHCQP